MLISQYPYLETIFHIFISKNFNEKWQGRAASDFRMLIFSGLFSGNSNFQGIWNWMLQILYYYCRKQHKNIKNSQIIEQNLVLFFPFSLFTVICASCHLPQGQNFFISWTKYFANFKCHQRTLVLYIVLFSGLKMIFTKFRQLDITARTKNCL